MSIMCLAMYMVYYGASSRLFHIVARLIWHMIGNCHPKVILHSKTFR